MTIRPETIEAAPSAQIDTGIWARLKAGTRPAHEKLDARVMAGKPFDSRENYGRFLLVQHDFHSIVSPLYQHADLAPLLPDLAARDRFETIGQDIADLGLKAPSNAPIAPAEPIDIPHALGWLYVAEGSNLGAAFLLKAARGLGLSEDFGARHLAGAAEGRGLHWRLFTSALDALDLSEADQAKVIEGANAGFDRVRDLVEIHMHGAGAN